jgi:hypothetical protein
MFQVKMHLITNILSLFIISICINFQNINQKGLLETNLVSLDNGKLHILSHTKFYRKLKKIYEKLRDNYFHLFLYGRAIKYNLYTKLKNIFF